MTTYQFDNAWQQARARLTALERDLDPATIWHLERLGVAAGWRCWDVGAGGGSIARWLCERVGSGGTVLATDIDTRFLDALTLPNWQVLHHDIVTEAGGFDRTYGRRLYRDMVIAGLEGVTGDGVLQLTAGADDIFRLGIAQRRERILATGRITEAELDQVMLLRADPAFALAAPTVWAVWGRRDDGASMPA